MTDIIYLGQSTKRDEEEQEDEEVRGGGGGVTVDTVRRPVRDRASLAHWCSHAHIRGFLHTAPYFGKMVKIILYILFLHDDRY